MCGALSSFSSVKENTALKKDTIKRIHRQPKTGEGAADEGMISRKDTTN